MALYGRHGGRWIKEATLPKHAKVREWRLDFYDHEHNRVREVFHGNRTDAKGALDERRAAVQRGKDGKAEGVYVNPRKVGHAAGPTFEEFAERFLNDYGDRRRSVYYRDALKSTGPIMRHFGSMRLREVTEADFARFARDRHRGGNGLRPVGPATIRKNLTLLGTMFRWAKRWKVIEANPAADLDKPSEPKNKVRFLSRAEYDALIEAAELWLRPIVTFAVVTGMRLGEITGCRWDDVDRSARLIHVPMDSKTGTRSIPLNRTAQAVLARQVRHLRSPFVFVTTEGQGYHERDSRNRISKRTKAAMKAAGVPDATFHTLRHTAASWMVQAGRPLAEVREILGHATIQTTLRYAHLQPQHLRDSMTALDVALSDGHSEDTGTEPIRVSH